MESPGTGAQGAFFSFAQGAFFLLLPSFFKAGVVLKKERGHAFFAGMPSFLFYYRPLFFSAIGPLFTFLRLPRACLPGMG